MLKVLDPGIELHEYRHCRETRRDRMVRMFRERRSLDPCLGIAFGGEMVRRGVLEDSLIPSWKLRQGQHSARSPQVEGASVTSLT